MGSRTFVSPFPPDIRSGEGRLTLGAILTIGAIGAGYAILETARDALFLAALPAARLATVYLLIAVLALALFAVGLRRPSASGNVSALATSLVAAAAVNVVFWLLLADRPTWLLYGLYIWSGVFASLILTGFWRLATGLFSIDQARRLFAAIAIGGGIGSALGAGAAAVLAAYLDARDLVLASSALFLVAGLGATPLLTGTHQRSMTTAAPNDSLAADLGTTLRALLAGTYLPRIGMIGLLAAATATLLDLIFKAALAGSIEATDLATAFGAAYFAIHLCAVLAQIFLVGWLVRRLEIERLLALAPALLLLAGAGIAAGLGLAGAVGARLIDGALRPSLGRTTLDLLYAPLGSALRGRVRSIVEAAGNHGGELLAVFLFFTITGLDSDTRYLALGAAGLAALGVAIALTAAKPYLRLFHRDSDGADLAARIAHPDLSRASLETLFARLSSPDDTEVLAALDILDAKGRTRLVPNLVLYHPSPRVVGRALELFRRSGREDFLPITERLLESESATIRAAALRSRDGLIVAGTHLPLLSDPDPAVRATAVATMALEESSRTADARREMKTLLATGSVEETRAIAAIAKLHAAAFDAVALVELSTREDLPTRRAATEAMGETRDDICLPRLIALLADADVRPAAHASLVAFGEPALSALRETLRDPDADPQIRGQVPRAVAAFRPRRVAAVLVGELQSDLEPEIVDAILRVLARLRFLHPTVALDGAVLTATLETTLRELYELLSWQAVLERGVQHDPTRATEAHGWIFALLQERRRGSTWRLLRILELIHGTTAVAPLRAARGVLPLSPELAKLRERIDATHREALLAVFEDTDTHTRLAKGSSFSPPVPETYESLLASWLRQGESRLRALAAYHAAELGRGDLRSEIDSLSEDADPLLGGMGAAAALLLEDRSFGG